jgi:hypothetical protein
LVQGGLIQPKQKSLTGTFRWEFGLPVLVTRVLKELWHPFAEEYVVIYHGLLGESETFHG